MRECSEDVRLGMTRLWSFWSLVLGRPSRSPVRGRTKEVCVLREGAIVMEWEDLSGLGRAGLVVSRGVLSSLSPVLGGGNM